MGIKILHAAKGIVLMLAVLILIHHDAADEANLEAKVVAAVDQVPGIPPWIVAFNPLIQFAVAWLVKVAQQAGFFAQLHKELDGLLASFSSSPPPPAISPTT